MHEDTQSVGHAVSDVSKGHKSQPKSGVHMCVLKHGIALTKRTAFGPLLISS
jgi:hypothetical protein